VLALAGWVTVCFGAAAFGALFPPGEWYDSLRKPSWTPPAWVFGPTWTLLYLLMGVAAWMVWLRGGWRAQRLPLGCFLAQLALNAAWSPLFFGLHRPDLALADILLLWLSIAATLAVFWFQTRLATLLLLPYLAWVTFAALLNLALWRLNR